jgi:hypothetical protein
MATSRTADAARLLKVQIVTCLLVWGTAILFWTSGEGSTITWIVTGLAVVDTAMCGYFFGKFRSIQRASSDESRGETPQDSLRRLTDSSEEQSAG